MYARRRDTPILTEAAILAVWTNMRTLPSPPSFDNLKEKLPSPSARSLHFLKEQDSLLVSYLEHGIVYDEYCLDLCLG